MQVFLIRHPRPVLAAKVCYGQLDVAAEDAARIADRLRRRLPPATPVIASPLSRARALAMALDSTPRFDDRLQEINFGAWEGRRWEEIEHSELDAWANDLQHYTPPGGESATQLQTRVVACLAELCMARVAVVSHAGPIRAFLGHWLQLPVWQWSRLDIAFGSLSHLEIVSGGMPILHYLNR